MVVYMVVVVVACAATSARASSPWPAWWYSQAMCIHRHESTNWHIHNPPYANGFQFTYGTWLRAGGRGSTWVSASPWEQTYRAWRIWRADGGSWREWPNTSRVCGIR